MTSPQPPEKTIDQATDDELLTSLRLNAQRANQPGLSQQVVDALAAARAGNLVTLDHAEEISKRLAAKDARIAELEAALAKQQSEQTVAAVAEQNHAYHRTAAPHDGANTKNGRAEKVSA